MKTILMIILAAGLFGLGACGFENKWVTAESNDLPEINNARNNQERTPVLVELFTSEGCSSCPPADRLLGKLETEQAFDKAEVITLSLHVDYWDGLGWKDPFSSPLFTRRQDIYGQAFRSSQVYTPQMVVDGRTEFVGSDAAKAAKAITENAGNEKARIKLMFDTDKLSLNISAVPEHENATVYLAFAEDDLSSDVARGENSGRNLKHTSVVRELKTLGMLPAGQTEFESSQTLQFQPNWKKENLKLVVFIQENQKRRVLGAARIKPF